MNKQGSEKILSIWWFFVLAVIGGGIVLGCLIYYSAETSVKKVEAEILGNKILECLSNQRYLNNKIFDKTFDIFQECNLNKNSFGKGSNFYLKISLYNNTNNLIYELNQGDFSFEKNCFISNKISAKKFPECSIKKEVLLNEEEKEIKLVILTASNQEGKKISTVE